MDDDWFDMLATDFTCVLFMLVQVKRETGRHKHNEELLREVFVDILPVFHSGVYFN